MPHKNEKTAKDSHYARLRRQHRDLQQSRQHSKGKGDTQDKVHLYGLHTVMAALANPKRHLHHLMVTQNAYARLQLENTKLPIEPEFCSPRQLDLLLGGEAVHQGIMLETSPLKPRPLSSLGEARLVVVLDQISDPHNVGALMRSSVAFNVSAMITTARHSAQTNGVLAKAASGALEMLDYIIVGNLAQALEQLHANGYTTIGLDSQAQATLEQTLERFPKSENRFSDKKRGETQELEQFVRLSETKTALESEKIALILGNEGKGLRAKTREVANKLARLDMPGTIKSLNVSNAGALSFYIADRFLTSCMK